MTYQLTGLFMFLRLNSSCLNLDRAGITIGRGFPSLYDGTKVYLILITGANPLIADHNTIRSMQHF
jgi:hypothetical protein